jgi:tape measure domain-containing protein
MGATVMHLTADETNGAMYAIQQMVSKGKVSTEELSRQLGERMPGTFQLAADAMGLTTKALAEHLKEGKIFAEDFLPKFAAKLKEHYGSGIEDASKSMQANLGRMSTAWFNFMSQMGMSKEGFINGAILKITSAIKLFGDAFKVTNSVAKDFRNFSAESFTFWDKTDSVVRNILRNLGASGGAIQKMSKGEYAEHFEHKNLIGKMYGVQMMKDDKGNDVLDIGKTKGKLQKVINLIKNQFVAFKEGAFGEISDPNTMVAYRRRLATLAGQKNILLGAISDYNREGSLNGTGGLNADGTTKTTKGGATSVEARKPQNFYITIGSLVEQMEIIQNSTAETAAEMKEVVVRTFVEALNDVQLIAAK